MNCLTFDRSFLWLYFSFACRKEVVTTPLRVVVIVMYKMVEPATDDHFPYESTLQLLLKTIRLLLKSETAQTAVLFHPAQSTEELIIASRQRERIPSSPRKSST